VREIGRAARRVADGDLGARVPRRGAEELVEVADAFNQMAAALEESETSRREFIANAAHELRTPLTNLKGFLEGLRDGVFEPDHDTFESLLEETDRLVRLSGSLVQLAEGDAQITPNQPRRMALAPVVRSAVALIRPAAQARNLSVSVGGAEGTAVSADPDRLRQVLANLLNNAVRYSTPGSSVAVHWEQRRDDVLVSVVNTGSAIPTAELPYVFERFFRVEKSRDRTRGGAGIGLAIVRQLVEAAGGHVGAESSNDRTRFWFTVTSAPPEDESVAISSRGAAQATQARTG
jgi:signal transduction histidine kinase